MISAPQQADEWIIAHLADGFQRNVSRPLHGSFIVLLEQDRANQTDDGVIIWEDADDLGAPLDLAVEALGNRYDHDGAI